MNRLNKLFQQKSKDILSIYITAGFPNLHDTVPVLEALEANGVDLIEIGIPFSDPMADGPVIQQSSQQALKNGISIKLLFEDLQNIREKVQIPLVAMGYLNPIMQYGFEEFCADCKQVGIDGMIIPDLPMRDYLENYKSIADSYGLSFIFLITPETSEERIREIDKNTNGFIYMVSSPGVTGTKDSFDSQIAYFERINRMNLKNPRLIGFGISNKATRDVVNQNSAGAIIGSAFIKAQNATSSATEAIQHLLKTLGVGGD